MAKKFWPEFFDSYPNIKFRMCYRACLFVAKPRQNTTTTAKNATMVPTFLPSWTPRCPKLTSADATNARAGARSIRGGRRRAVGAAMRRGDERIAGGPPGSPRRDSDGVRAPTAAERADGRGRAARAIKTVSGLGGGCLDRRTRSERRGGGHVVRARVAPRRQPRRRTYPVDRPTRGRERAGPTTLKKLSGLRGGGVWRCRRAAATRAGVVAASPRLVRRGGGGGGGIPPGAPAARR